MGGLLSDTEFYRYAHDVNIIVMGISGVGKSQLIKEILPKKQRGKVQVGTGASVTKTIDRFRVDDHKIVLFDTQGLEAYDYDKTKEVVTLFVEDSHKKKVKDQVHIIWYLVGSEQFDVENDIQTIQSLMGRVVIILVLSKSLTEDLPGPDEECPYNTLQRALPNIPIVPVLAKKMTLLTQDGKYECQPFGVDTLIQTTLCAFPKAFSIASTRHARNWINTARAWSIIALLGSGSLSAVTEVFSTTYVHKLPLIGAFIANQVIDQFHNGNRWLMIHAIAGAYGIRKKLIPPIRTLCHLFLGITTDGWLPAVVTNIERHINGNETWHGVTRGIIKCGMCIFVGAAFIYCLDKILVEITEDDRHATENNDFCWPPHNLADRIRTTYHALLTKLHIPVTQTTE